MSFREILCPVGQAIGKAGFAKTVEQAVVGVEFENETINGFDLPNITGYTFHQEGSLRNFGFEYVFRLPVEIKQVKELILRYFEAIDKAKGARNSLLCSPRTSTHVHFDVTRMNLVQVISFASVYWLLESLFSEYCGEERKGNLFCLRQCDASLFQTSLAESIHNGQVYRSGLFNNENRYGSLNLSALVKFGSLESRLMRGLSDPNTAINWIDMLECCRLFSLKMGTPRELHQKFLKEYSSDSFHEAVLGKNLALELEKYLPKGFDIAQNIRNSFLQICPLLLSGGDWLFEKQIAKEAERSHRSAAEPLIISRAIFDALQPAPPRRLNPAPIVAVANAAEDSISGALETDFIIVDEISDL